VSSKTGEVQDELPYQMVRDRIMVTLYGNTGISIDSGRIISGRERDEIVSFFL